MPISFPYHPAPSAPGLLDLSGTHLFPETNQQTPARYLPAIENETPAQDQRVTPPARALPPLAHLLLAANLAALYKCIFPEEPTWLEETVADWHSEEAVAAAIERYLQRVAAFFPVHEEIWEADLEAIAWRLEEIPIIPQGFDEWYEGWEAYDEPVPYLLHLACACENLFGEPAMAQQKYLAYLLPQDLTPFQLVPRLRQLNLSPPLDALPDLIQMLAHETDNPWLDIGEIAIGEGDGYPPWEAETVAWLTTEWQKALPILDRVEALLLWSSTSPQAIGEKLAAVRAALLAAYHHQPAELSEAASGVSENNLEKESP